MLNFTSSTPQDFSDFGRQLWLKKNTFASHEQVSQYIVEQLYQEFLTDDGQPQLALVRIFRLTDVDDLPQRVRALVSADEREVMALTGTWGIEEAWQHRSRSEGHQAVPISAIAIPDKIPMFQSVLAQLGIDIEHFYRTQELIAVGDRPYQGTFFIPDATVPAIPAQEGFVRPYDIQSLVGFGGFMGSEGTIMYLLYAFSQVPVSQKAAQAFFYLQEFIGTTLAVPSRIFDEV